MGASQSSLLTASAGASDHAHEPVGIQGYLASLAAMIPSSNTLSPANLYAVAVSHPVHFVVTHPELLSKACAGNPLPLITFDAGASILAVLHMSMHAHAASALHVYAAPPDPSKRDVEHESLRLPAPLFCYATPADVPGALSSVVAIDIPAGTRCAVLYEPVSGVVAILPVGAELSHVHRAELAAPSGHASAPAVATMIMSTVNTNALTENITASISLNGGMAALMEARLREFAIVQAAFVPQNIALLATSSGFMLREGVLAAAATRVGVPHPHSTLSEWMHECEARNLVVLSQTAAALRCFFADLPVLTSAARDAVRAHFTAPVGDALLREFDASCEHAARDASLARIYIEFGTLIGQEVRADVLAANASAIRLLRTFVETPVDTPLSRSYIEGMGEFNGFVVGSLRGELARGTPPAAAWTVFSSIAAALERVAASAAARDAPNAPLSRLLRTAWELAAADVARLCTALQLPSSLAAADAYMRPAAQRAISLLLIGEALHVLLFAPERRLRASAAVDPLVNDVKSANERRACAPMDITAASVEWLKTAQRVLARVLELPKRDVEQEHVVVAELAARIASNVPGSFSSADFKDTCVALAAWLAAATASKIGADVRAVRVANLARVMGDFASAYRICLPCIAEFGVECRGPKCNTEDT